MGDPNTYMQNMSQGGSGGSHGGGSRDSSWEFPVSDTNWYQLM